MQTKTTHSPAPWYWDESDFGEDWPKLIAPDGHTILMGDIPVTADANLIAAAPALLEALEALLRETEWLAAEGIIDAGYVPYNEINGARAAIAQAKGEAA